MNDQDLEMLSGVPLFALLSARERATLAQIVTRVRFEKGQTVFRQGVEGDTMYVVARGRIQIYVLDAEGRKLVLGTNKRGDVFGEVSLLDGGLRTASAVAIEDAELLSLGRDDLVELVTRHPHAALHLLAMMGQRLRTTNELIRQQVARNANVEERIVSSLGRRMLIALTELLGSWPMVVMALAAALVGSLISSRLVDLGAEAAELARFAIVGYVGVVLPLVLLALTRLTALSRIKADLDYTYDAKQEVDMAKLMDAVGRIQDEILSQKTQIARREALDSKNPNARRPGSTPPGPPSLRDPLSI